jgi:hypothetical protein
MSDLDDLLLGPDDTAIWPVPEDAAGEAEPVAAPSP